MINKDKYIDAKFSSVGIFRKLYISFLWFITVFLSIGCCIWLFFPEIMGEELGFSNWILVGISSAAFIYTAWNHYAITRRKMNHLIILGLIQIVLLNLFGIFIYAALYRASKAELSI